MQTSAFAKTMTALAHARIVESILGRFVARRPLWPSGILPTATPHIPRLSGPQRPRVSFVVQYYARSSNGLVPLRPMEVPDAEGALMCIDAMPAPVASAVAFRIESHSRDGDDETRTIIASRDSHIAG